MATDEERLAAVEESLTQTRAVGQTMLGIVKDTDVTVRSIQAHQTIVDARLGAVEARLSAVDARVNALALDTQRSFQQVAQAQQQMEDRIIKRIDGLGDQLAQVLAALTRKEE